MENMAKSLKSKEMAEITMRNQKAQSYGEGYADGFSAGYDKALENLNKHTFACTTIDEINKALAENGDGFIKAMWCGEEECEDKVKELTGVGSRCIPFEQENLSESCVCCGKPAKHMVYWGKAY